MKIVWECFTTMKKNKEDFTKYGFREDFDFEHRWRLQTRVKQKGKYYLVSTVDLGINHRFGEGDPLYYETMIFRCNFFGTPLGWDEDNKYENFQERYTTKEDALARHWSIVKLLRKGYDPYGNKQ